MSLQASHKCTDWERLPWGSWHGEPILRCRCLDCESIKMAHYNGRFFSKRTLERYIKEGYKEGW